VSLSPKAAAARLGLSVGRVRQLIASGALRAVNVGPDRPVWAIDETELERFAALDRPGHRPQKETSMKTFTVMGINQPSVFDLQPGQKAYPIRYSPLHQGAAWTEVHAQPGRKNMSHEICTLGWLGTTNDVQADALGEYEIVSITTKTLKDGREQVKVTVR
jgi:excisionase family DNA binding protein